VVFFKQFAHSIFGNIQGKIISLPESLAIVTAYRHRHPPRDGDNLHFATRHLSSLTEPDSPLKRQEMPGIDNNQGDSQVRGVISNMPAGIPTQTGKVKSRFI